MKLKSGLYVNEVGNEFVVLAEKSSIFKGMIRINKSGAFLFEKLKDGISYDELVNALTEKYEVEESVAKSDLDRFIKTFEDCGLIEYE